MGAAFNCGFIRLCRCRLSSFELPSEYRRSKGRRTRQLPRLLAGSDLLVLPYNFDARSARYIRLSFPTKAPAYMMSATPILVYAPADVATARYAVREGWGHVVSVQGQESLITALKSLMDDPSLRERLGRQAQAVALARHDAGKVRAEFWNALAAAAVPI